VLLGCTVSNLWFKSMRVEREATELSINNVRADYRSHGKSEPKTQAQSRRGGVTRTCHARTNVVPQLSAVVGRGAGGLFINLGPDAFRYINGRSYDVKTIPNYMPECGRHRARNRDSLAFPPCTRRCKCRVSSQWAELPLASSF
jgi:hypothetical protein